MADKKPGELPRKAPAVRIKDTTPQPPEPTGAADIPREAAEALSLDNAQRPDSKKWPGLSVVNIRSVDRYTKVYTAGGPKGQLAKFLADMGLDKE